MRYDYYCEKCEERWEESHSMDDRNKPLELECPHCQEMSTVRRGVFTMSISYNGGKTVLQRAGSGWNDVLNKVKKASARKNTIETR